MKFEKFLAMYEPFPIYQDVEIYDYDLDEDGGRSTNKPCYKYGTFTKKKLQDSGRFDEYRVVFFDIKIHNNEGILQIFIKTIS